LEQIEQSDRQKNAQAIYLRWLMLLAGMMAVTVPYVIYDHMFGADKASINVAAPQVPPVAVNVDVAASKAPPVDVAFVALTAAESGGGVYLGIDAGDIDAVVAGQLGLSSTCGVLVNAVIPGSPAATAGLERGDVLISLDNRPVTGLDGLKALVATLTPSQVVRVVFIRDGVKKSAYITVAGTTAILRTAAAAPPSDSQAWGMTVGPLTSKLRATYGIPDDLNGVAVLGVTPGGQADTAGIRMGDVISGLDKTATADMQDFFKAAYADDSKTSLLNVYSQGQFQYIALNSLQGNAVDAAVVNLLADQSAPYYISILHYVMIVGVIGFIAAIYIYFSLFRYSPGNEKMQYIARKIRSGTSVFLKQEYKTAAFYLMVFFIALSFMLGISTGGAFILGAFCSMLPGWIGIRAATIANVRTCQAAKEENGLHKALQIAFRGGAVMGLAVASIGIIGLCGYILIVMAGQNPKTVVYVVTGFAFGASFFALLGRVGGGIFTKSADIGADMVGKLELGLREDDARNPAVIADNVGDNVGDVAGMGADLFESYIAALVGTVIMAMSMPKPMQYMTLPFVLAAIGLLASMISMLVGRLFMRTANPQGFLKNMIFLSGIIFAAGAFAATSIMTGDMKLFLVILIGVACGTLVSVEVEFFASGKKPMKYVTRMSKAGAGTNIISGLVVGFQGAFLPMVTVCAAVIVIVSLAGAYGLGLSAVAMLATIAITMCVDAYGPIVDNAGGIAQMSGAKPEVRRITDILDVAGNTTAAIGKGFSITAGIVTALAYFGAYASRIGFEGVELFNTRALVGLFIGATFPFLFAALTMGAVSHIAERLVSETRRQMREIKGLLSGEAAPQSDRCIEIISRDSLRGSILTGLIAVAMPFIITVAAGINALAGFLVGAMVVGSILGMAMSIGGATWDNAKKYIERERDAHGGMDEAYKAAVVGDMVGDPFKDVAGPSMNILIKLMITVALVLCPILLKLAQ